MGNEDIIFFDTEFTGNGELLELAIINGDGALLYHSYFKPITSKQWKTDIHHISPEMVANERSFSSCLPEIQPIFNNAKVLSGFSLKNDLKILEEHGIQNLRDKKIIDIHDYFWLIHKDEVKWNLDSMPSLIKCSKSLGIDFNEEDAHSASFDTELTLKCYNLLNQRFSANDSNSGDYSLLADAIINSIEKAKLEYYRKKAIGYIKVYKNNKGYYISFTSTSDKNNENLIFEVKIENRYKAEYEIRKLFKNKLDKKLSYIYNLRSNDLERIKAYQNTYDKDEAEFYKNLMRNKDKISF